ncbi:hypothetical protein [Luteibacter sp. UNCMF331Sha3.1]|uniref:hypothetical protein n=1 Tax=Luteibacter sp. UNCMF331Sha3.1 TaxID=1502760 RepID=UPI0004AE59EB
MMKTIRSGGRKAIALSVACALMLPMAALPDVAHAQSKSKKSASREAELESRVNQLEQQLAELKAMIQEQKAATTQATATAQAAQTQVQQTDEKVAKVEKTVAAVPAKPTFSSAPGVSVALHGFINVSGFKQDANYQYGNGQNAEYPLPGPTGRANSITGVDVRNTRFWLDFTGGKFNESWAGSGRIEMDFFGGFNGTGAYSQQQPAQRLRQAYMDITNVDTGTTFRIGQMWQLLFPLDYVPQSLSHIAFPLGYGTGLIGWRYPGIVWMQELNHGSDGVKWRFDLGAYEGSWSGPGLTTNYLTAGNAGFKPQIQARITAKGKNWQVFAAGHYSRVDLHGVDGETVTPIKSDIKSTAVEVGGMWMPGNFIVKGAVYTGNAIGQIFGDLSQFGDIKDKGGWLQLGYKFDKHWTVFGFVAASKLDEGDVLRWRAPNTAGLLKNRQQALSLQYSVGAFDFSGEVIHSKLNSTTTNGLGRQRTSGNEYTLNALYKF